MVSARFPYLIVRIDRGRYKNMAVPYQDFASDGLPIERLGPIEKRRIVVDSRSVSQDGEFPGRADCCIHPGTALRVAAAQLDAPASSRLVNMNMPRSPILLDSRYGELRTVIMEVSYGCLDAPCEKIALELKADQMHTKLFSNGHAGAITIS
ncbi:MAG TPA: hypothetical protein VND19_19540 [Acetobacteraceae bacterium]|nr:hypothetical protein [Acetobacteraceae bacterium]